MRPNGGAAFPRPCSEANGDKGEMWNDSEFGMTMRDYFAAKALQSCLQEWLSTNEGTWQTKCQQAADMAYDVADAMLAQGQKRYAKTP